MERKLYRSKNNKVLLGVCGGVAEYIHADATLIRLIFLLLCIGAGAGLILYIAAAIVMPENNSDVELITDTNKKKLYKSNTDKKICGVCGGVAEFFHIDSTIIRLVWLITVFCVGTGLLAYIIMAIVMPEHN